MNSESSTDSAIKLMGKNLPKNGANLGPMTEALLRRLGRIAPCGDLQNIASDSSHALLGKGDLLVERLVSISIMVASKWSTSEECKLEPDEIKQLANLIFGLSLRAVRAHWPGAYSKHKGSSPKFSIAPFKQQLNSNLKMLSDEEKLAPLSPKFIKLLQSSASSLQAAIDQYELDRTNYRDLTDCEVEFYQGLVRLVGGEHVANEIVALLYQEFLERGMLKPSECRWRERIDITLRRKDPQ